MKSTAALLLLLVAAGSASAQDDAELRRRIDAKEVELKRLDDDVRRALDDGNVEKAERLNREYRELKREVEELKASVGRERRDPGPWERRPASKGDRWADDTTTFLSVELLATNWASGLHVSDGTGIGLEIAVPDWLFFQYRTWSLEDDATGVDVRAQAYLFGFTESISLQGARHLFDVAAAFGILNLSADDGGPATDSGPMVSLQPTYRWYFRENLSFHVGGSFDGYWTDFNRGRTHDFWNASLTVGLMLRF